MLIKVYLISCDGDSCDGIKKYKIGFTRRKVENRIKEFKTGNSSDFEIIHVYESKWGTKIESILHSMFKTKSINGEWFNLTYSDVESFIYECEKIHNTLEFMSRENTYIIDRNILNKKQFYK
jgi:hypothetical protein